MRSPRIIFVSPYDPRNVRKWSGTLFFLYRALVERFGSVPFVSGGPIDFAVAVLSRVMNRIGLGGDWRFSSCFAHMIGAYVSFRLLFKKGDVIIAVIASSYLPYLYTRRPVIYISDATFASISRLYPDFAEFPVVLKKQAEAMEAAAIARAAYAIYPSSWAIESAVSDYGAKRSKLILQPFGPNIPSEYIDKHFKPKSVRNSHSIRIMFNGVEWARKGGDVVIETCEELIERGYEVSVVLVGRIPPERSSIPFVDYAGFVDKSTSAGLDEMCRLISSVDFLMVPTRADAYGIVFAEAQALGVPCVSYDVGGVSSSIEDGVTGIVEPLGSDSKVFADRIEHLWRSPDLYESFSRNCRNKYIEKANWPRWAEVIEELSVIALSPNIGSNKDVRSRISDLEGRS